MIPGCGDMGFTWLEKYHIPGHQTQSLERNCRRTNQNLSLSKLLIDRKIIDFCPFMAWQNHSSCQVGTKVMQCAESLSFEDIWRLQTTCSIIKYYKN